MNFMNTLILRVNFGSLVFLSSQAYSAEQVIYDREAAHTLRNFTQFLEEPSQTLGRPSIELGTEGLVGKPGNGNFTAHKFADLVSKVRGGVPKALLLQAFFYNGFDVTFPHISRMTLDQR